MGQRDGSDTLRRAVVVARDEALGRRTVRHLADLGLEAARTTSFARARGHLSAESPPDLLLVDFERPATGALIAHARALPGPLRVLVMDGLGDETSASDAFAAGADDVIHAPFPFAELAARLGFATPQPAHDRATALLPELSLTPVEREIMVLLLERPGELVTRDQLARRIDRSDWTYGDRKFDVHVTNIRKKLSSRYGSRYTVGTVRSLGYVLREESAD